MAKQDDFVRITLRLPADLHEQLVASAGARSLNAEIVSRLEFAMEHADALKDLKTRIARIEALDAIAEALKLTPEEHATRTGAYQSKSKRGG